MADAKLHAKLLQANLESMVQQLDAKSKEAAAASQEVATQKQLVQQITKKLDVSPGPPACTHSPPRSPRARTPRHGRR